MSVNFFDTPKLALYSIFAAFSNTWDIKYELYRLETKKVKWLNNDDIRMSGVAEIHEIHGVTRRGWLNFPPVIFGKGLNLEELDQSLKNVFSTRKVDRLTIDISDVDGLATSKAFNEEYSTMYEFVEAKCRNYFDISESALNKNLSHQGIKIIHDQSNSDYFCMYGWSSKLYLCNFDGSHHFASAQYIAGKLPKHVPLSGKLKLTYIDSDGLSNFISTYQTFLMSCDDFSKFYNIFKDSRLDLIFFTPRALPDGMTILFYKKNKFPTSLDLILKKKFTDFNKELEKYHNFQKSNEKFIQYLSS
ncbi:DUF6685 family protein [Acinetobacter soli]|uniref:DUF6685 family protein n=1 Tax=Acinetobacter soli TaxID=487316 RepID=UPI003A85861E